jgi:hypothetical protein
MYTHKCNCMQVIDWYVCAMDVMSLVAYDIMVSKKHVLMENNV